MTQSATEAPSASGTEQKWVYLFREGNGSMRDLLGGKGAGVAEMTRAGLPVPPGFTITTAACNAYLAAGGEFPPGLWQQALDALHDVEEQTGKQFGNPANPLLVSVRSGAKFSMPGMMDTVLNLGLNDETTRGLAAQTDNERFAYDAYRRFIQMYGKIVLGIDADLFEHALDALKQQTGAATDADLSVDALQRLVAEFKDIVQQQTGEQFPTNPEEQLHGAIAAVFRSWNGARARAYREAEGIPHDLGTAVNVQAMVFGNMGNDSGTGVAFTRNPSTGEHKLYGEYLLNAQGEDVVAGIRTPQPISALQRDMPDVYQQFQDIATRMERHYRDMQDLEFTIERGKLYMLQTRNGKRTAAAAVKVATDMVHEGTISKEEALLRIDPKHVVQLLLPRFDDRARNEALNSDRFLAKGLNASPGAAVGKAVFDADRAAQMGNNGESVILVRPETSPDDVHGMIAAKGILTARGGATSHAAVVARGMGKPCVAGVEALKVDLANCRMSVDGKTINEGDVISIDGATGEVFQGAIETIAAKFSEETELAEVLGWADEIRRLQVWANADYPRDAERAREYGAEGIGLCRTEHMFFEEERLPIVHQMILSAEEAARQEAALTQLEEETARASRSDPKLEERLHQARKNYDDSPDVKNYREALEKLLPIQKDDFKGVLKAMHGLPVVIRLIDPPLHEFLPSYEELIEEVTTLRIRGDNPKELGEKEKLLSAVARMREQNPMLGLRGIRLGILYPAIIDMQVRAILSAAVELTREGVDVHPEIMVPLVGTEDEMRLSRGRIERVAKEVLDDAGVDVRYKIGTMIEVPRAALTAAAIALDAEFFSFGTNDLTQTTFGYSRDDAEGKFLLRYVEMGILPANPFQELDREGVGKLMRMAVQDGRATRGDLEIGICGEHGGDPSSVAFCNEIGLNYVSCSPFRVPVARLAAAQAVIEQETAKSDTR
ncbi:MAG TPA: pyruvate, phosphate dikinase [Chloroflexota bacterium]|nr:pyruvate, phosphate dikinase [Chloroflexota bacterium]